MTKSASAVLLDTLVIPDLVYILDYLLRINGMALKPQKEWPDDMGFDYIKLNAQAAQLSKEEKELVIDGGIIEDVDILVKDKGIQQLSSFLEEVSYGYLADCFN